MDSMKDKNQKMLVSYNKIKENIHLENIHNGVESKEKENKSSSKNLGIERLNVVHEIYEDTCKYLKNTYKEIALFFEDCLSESDLDKIFKNVESTSKRLENCMEMVEIVNSRLQTIKSKKFNGIESDIIRRQIEEVDSDLMIIDEMKKNITHKIQTLKGVLITIRMVQKNIRLTINRKLETLKSLVFHWMDVVIKYRGFRGELQPLGVLRKKIDELKSDVNTSHHFDGVLQKLLKLNFEVIVTFDKICSTLDKKEEYKLRFKIDDVFVDDEIMMTKTIIMENQEPTQRWIFFKGLNTCSLVIQEYIIELFDPKVTCHI
jgi:hypothetical protein